MQSVCLGKLLDRPVSAAQKGIASRRRRGVTHVRKRQMYGRAKIDLL
jgi:hypothetical protein